MSARRHLLILLPSIAFVFLLVAPGLAGDVHLLPFEGAITPVAAEYLVEGIQAAEEGEAEAVIILLDTPGGLDSSMRLIVKAELNARVPVVVFVAPAGSRAAGRPLPRSAPARARGARCEAKGRRRAPST